MAFAGDDTGGYGAGGERIAMEDWRMFARRRPKTSNSESVVRDEFMRRRGGFRTSDCDALLPW